MTRTTKSPSDERPDIGWDPVPIRRKIVASILSKSIDLSGKRLARTHEIGGYVFRSYRGRYFDVSEGENIKLRGVTIAIERDGNIVGVAKLKEWWLPLFSSPLDFWDTTDNLSQEHADLAELVGASWDWHEWPPEYGNIVLFSRLAIDSRLDAGREALNRLGEYLTIEFGRRASVMLLKAFPLEFENALTGDDGRRRAKLQHRSRAMLRMYARSLCVQPLPDQGVFSGWMWRQMRYCPDPAPIADADWREQY